MDKITLGVIIGNRDFFADELCKEGRKRLMPVLEENGINPIVLDEDEGVYGSVQNRDDARKCAALLRKHSDEIKGIIVTLPNFGDEKSIVETIKMSGLDVPVLVHAFSDDIEKLDYIHRRDSFCGKISVCNNLRQYGINYTLTSSHTINPDMEQFQDDLNKFIGVCNVFDKIKGARIGLIGARPADFNTVRFSEKILQHNGISVEPIGLLDLMNKLQFLEDSDQKVKEGLKEIESYMNTDSVPGDSLVKMAKLLLVYRDWVVDNEIDAVAFQCWDSLQGALGINPCTVMSILSNEGVPSACESDVMGALSMYALQAASKLPSGIVDWNNNYQNDPDKAVIFHCGNFARDIYSCSGNECPKVNYPEILGSTLGQENTYGAIEGRIKADEISFARVSTDDTTGKIQVYLAEGEITEKSLDTFGSWGVARVAGLQKLMNYICSNGFEHHVAINLSSVADILEEAFNNYLGWDVYNHKGDN
ncbi:L-fucose/L-arabinose isomerase family protein [Halocella sp. SP3-1]|uniref:L-fucose/L-arabinose isomerase family protein n=1 Tax=Halocella sp. SP3-1 TaxID=2382161 RepID=UPI000F75157A|nr:L-fucose/L-arabinose isomerase family protein [Halocella sp. SP3-1]AZO95816.1 fucose isomerase [Halocella sp. SP3-1]